MSAIPQFSDNPSEERAFQEHENRLEAFGKCWYCNHPVDASRDYRRVTGWVRGSTGDGFVRDGSEDQWAHRHCIGQIKGQESLDV